MSDKKFPKYVEDKSIDPEETLHLIFWATIFVLIFHIVVRSLLLYIYSVQFTLYIWSCPLRGSVLVKITTYLTSIYVRLGILEIGGGQVKGSEKKNFLLESLGKNFFPSHPCKKKKFNWDECCKKVDTLSQDKTHLIQSICLSRCLEIISQEGERIEEWKPVCCVKSNYSEPHFSWWDHSEFWIKVVSNRLIRY